MSRQLTFLLVLCGLVMALKSVAIAQENIPYVPPELVDRTRPLNASILRICVWQNSPLRAFEEAVASEIAYALLLEPEIKSIGRHPPTNDNDFWEAIYLALHNECDALMGHILVVNQLPEWLTASRPYYETPAVLAVTTDYADLSEVPKGSLIGSQLATATDYQLLRYLQSSDARWRRLPYDSVDRMVRDLKQGIIEAAVVQEAALLAALDFQPQTYGIRTVSLAPLAEASTEFVIVYLSSEASLRTILDEAIKSLREEGAIALLALDAGLSEGQ